MCSGERTRRPRSRGSAGAPKRVRTDRQCRASAAAGCRTFTPGTRPLAPPRVRRSPLRPVRGAGTGTRCSRPRRRRARRRAAPARVTGTDDGSDEPELPVPDSAAGCGSCCARSIASIFAFIWAAMPGLPAMSLVVLDLRLAHLRARLPGRGGRRRGPPEQGRRRTGPR